MSAWIDTLVVCLFLTDLVLLGSSRLRTCIQAVAFQGITLAFLPLLAAKGFTPRLALLGLAVMALKGFVFPWLLLRALRESRGHREVTPLVGYTSSLFAGALFFALSLWLEARLALPTALAAGLAVPAAITTLLVGLFLVVARCTALNQVIGYLVLENGIYTLGVLLVGEIPLLVELGVLMDAFVAVFVMGIAIYRIREEFDHMDALRLSELKG